MFDSGGVRDGTFHDVVDTAGSESEIWGSDCDGRMIGFNDWVQIQLRMIGFKFIFPVIRAKDFKWAIGKIEEVMTFADVIRISGVEGSHNIELLKTGHWFTEKVGNWR